jgi:hypothetical protein
MNGQCNTITKVVFVVILVAVFAVLAVVPAGTSYTSPLPTSSPLPTPVSPLPTPTSITLTDFTVKSQCWWLWSLLGVCK